MEKKSYHDRFDSFYNSPEWKALRNQKFVDADGLCELCQQKGKVKVAKEVHHIKPIEYYWEQRLDYDNLICLCAEHHREQHNRDSSLQKFMRFWDSM